MAISIKTNVASIRSQRNLAKATKQFSKQCRKALIRSAYQQSGGRCGSICNQFTDECTPARLEAS